MVEDMTGWEDQLSEALQGRRQSFSPHFQSSLQEMLGSCHLNSPDSQNHTVSDMLPQNVLFVVVFLNHTSEQHASEKRE